MNSQIIPKQRAETSLSSKAKEISAGKKTTRVRLGNTTNLGLLVAATKISDSLFDSVYAFFATSTKKYVEVDIDNQRVLLNVNSIADRLHLTKKEVLQAAKQGNLLDTLNNQAKSTESVLKNYNEIMTDYFSKDNKKNLKTTAGEKTTLTSSQVMKVIRVTLDKEVGSVTGLESKPIIARHIEKGKVDLGWVTSEINSGSFGTVFNVNLAEGMGAYKLPKKSSEFESLKNEVNIVNKLNKTGSQDGISRSVHLVEPISASKKNKKPLSPGILMQKYDNDYTKDLPRSPLIDMTKKELTKISTEFEKLLSGLNYMHSLDILHGDIKPGNILQKDGRTDLIDFGTARDVHNNQNPIATSGSFYYCHANDFTAQDSIVDTPGSHERLVALEKARDVFALGATFYERFHTDSLFKERKEGKLNLGEERNPLRDFVPQEIRTLIEKMTDPDWEKRITAEQALNELKAYRATL